MGQPAAEAAGLSVFREERNAARHPESLEPGGRPAGPSLPGHPDPISGEAKPWSGCLRTELYLRDSVTPVRLLEPEETRILSITRESYLATKSTEELTRCSADNLETVMFSGRSQSLREHTFSLLPLVGD